MAGSPSPDLPLQTLKTSLEASLGLFFAYWSWKLVYIRGETCRLGVLTPACGLRPSSQVSVPGPIPPRQVLVGGAASFIQTCAALVLLPCYPAATLEARCTVELSREGCQQDAHSWSRSRLMLRAKGQLLPELLGAEPGSCKPSLHKPGHHPS